MALQLGWWGLAFLLYLVLLDRFATLWGLENPTFNLTRALPKAKRTKKAPTPRTPLDCRHCQVQAKAAPAPTLPASAAFLSVPAYSQLKSKRGRPKKITTQGYACPNPKCLYFGCAEAAFHALVGD